MDPTAALVADEMRFVLEQAALCLGDLLPEQLNNVPAVPEANSPAVIVRHLCEVARVYILGFGCGQDVTRDRPAEFRSTYRDAFEAVAELEATAADIVAALAAVSPETLDEVILPSRELWGTGEIHQVQRRERVVHALRHSAIHLGELRLTRTLVLAGV